MHFPTHRVFALEHRETSLRTEFVVTHLLEVATYRASNVLEQHGIVNPGSGEGSASVLIAIMYNQLQTIRVTALRLASFGTSGGSMGSVSIDPWLSLASCFPPPVRRTLHFKIALDQGERSFVPGIIVLFLVAPPHGEEGSHHRFGILFVNGWDASDRCLPVGNARIGQPVAIDVAGG